MPTLPFMPLDPFVATQEGGPARTDAPATLPARADASAAGIAGIVLAGSHHWGDGVFERVLRGPLLPVAHTPLIEYPLQWLRDAGIRSAILCANSATRSLKSVLGETSGETLRLGYFEDSEPRGPAGCARDAALMTEAERFVVIEGTIVPTLDFDAMLAAHRASGAAATVVVEFDRRRRGMASGIRRQPAGIYVFERSALLSVAEHGYQDIKEGLLGRLSASGANAAMHEVRGLSAKVLDYSSYAAVSRWLVSRAIERPSFLAHYDRVGDGLHHPTAVVHPTARLVGPVLLAAGARVEQHAVIVGPASIGQRSIIGAGALVSRSFIWDDCVVGEESIVDSSVLADRCHVLSGERVKSATQLPEQFGHVEPGGAMRAPATELLPDVDTSTERLRRGFGGTVAADRDRASAP
ncbi:MAG: NDP-sugar synthase [Gemmatimonadaceae bacterium]|nr:NDP-sugar synthase [Gemmatimonadaceae bacterium]